MQRYLVIHYSQTGQTGHVASMIEQMLAPRGNVDHLRILPQETYPFPWGIKDFFGVFPRCILNRPPAVWVEGSSEGDYDMIFLLAQVWFLSPSLPIQGFFASSHAQVLKKAKIHLILTCRNMWMNTAWSIREALANHQADVVHLSVLKDTSPGWLSFITTPMWLIKGKKKLPGLREAGIDHDEYDRFAREFKRLYEGHTSSAALPREGRTVIIMELIGRRLFARWATILDRHDHPPLQGILQILFRMHLAGAILLALITVPILSHLFARRFSAIMERQWQQILPQVK